MVIIMTTMVMTMSISVNAVFDGLCLNSSTGIKVNIKDDDPDADDDEVDEDDVDDNEDDDDDEVEEDDDDDDEYFSDCSL